MTKPHQDEIFADVFRFEEREEQESDPYAEDYLFSVACCGGVNEPKLFDVLQHLYKQEITLQNEVNAINAIGFNIQMDLQDLEPKIKISLNLMTKFSDDYDAFLLRTAKKSEATPVNNLIREMIGSLEGLKNDPEYKFSLGKYLFF